MPTKHVVAKLGTEGQLYDFFCLNAAQHYITPFLFSQYIQVLFSYFSFLTKIFLR